jgi:hypothetical protein
MNDRQCIQRELRNARRVITNPDKFSSSLIDTAWAVIRSANRQNIYLHPMPFVSASDAYSCSPSQQSNTGCLHEVQT